MFGAGYKRTATEPAPDTRTSTRTKTASSKQREISKSPVFSLATTICITRKDEQTEAGTLKELEQVKRQLTQQKRRNQKLAELFQGN